MNQVSRTTLTDTPNYAQQLREAVGSAGYTITGLPETMTREQAIDVAEDLHRQVGAISANLTPLGAAALNALDTVAFASGWWTVEELAAEAGVDLATATVADGTRLATLFARKAALR